MTTTGTPSRESKFFYFPPPILNANCSDMVPLHTEDTAWDLSDSSHGSASSTQYAPAAYTHGLWVAASRDSCYICLHNGEIACK
jgi:hypothetical protein